MKNLFLEDELKYFFLRFYWDVCLFTLVKPIIMGGGGGGGCGFHFAMTLTDVHRQIDFKSDFMIYSTIIYIFYS